MNLFFKLFCSVMLLAGLNAKCSFKKNKRTSTEFTQEVDHISEVVTPFPRKLQGTGPNNITGGFAPFCQLTNGGFVENPSRDDICAAYLGIKSDFEAAVVGDKMHVANLVAIAVRLAFHDAGEADVRFPTDALGPDGCISDLNDDSAGLLEPDSLVTTVLEPIWQKYCDKMSRADFWVLFAALALEFSDPTKSIAIKFQYGRKDLENCNGGSGRLPNAELGFEEIGRTFLTQMGLTWNDAVTLIGAHTLGHTHIKNTGYGFGTDECDLRLNAWDKHPERFDNEFFRNILSVDRKLVRTEDRLKHQWKALRHTQPTIMLNSDMVLIFDPNITEYGQRCGPTSAITERNPKVASLGCSPNNTFFQFTSNLVHLFAQDNDAFLAMFSEAFWKMSSVTYEVLENGVSVPAIGEPVAPFGKRGFLHQIDLNSC